MTQFNPLANHPDPGSVRTGRDARLLFRDPASTPFLQTTGMAPGFMQASPIILPGELALDFATFCQRNPKPCPLVATSNRGSPTLPTLGDDLDLRSDLGGYRIWRHGELVEEVTGIGELWRDDFVGFAVGCSYSFEDALVRDGIEVRHISQGVCVPMYMTNVPLEPSGPFAGRMCVTMRPMTPRDAIRAIEITSRFPLTHGTPVHIGDPGQIGIDDLETPLVGDPVEVREGEICVFWGCSITPQYAMLQAKPEIAITHKPGCLLMTDVPSRGDAIDLPSLAA
ncbi:MAG: putative hydro-lyase [Alphaproteobacteria bacterium]|jgi:uncharacterized protein YcsI (UPF0317 family)|nr:putative hydro-lyase [Alphaproteobacteria bacterium]MDP6565297.1 putative hydro-lyase [Alphaproteobacteria bacterium]MDP6812070.1 putative hydro-lyase [Alphaproteobacteria bacterium]